MTKFRTVTVFPKPNFVLKGLCHAMNSFLKAVLYMLIVFTTFCFFVDEKIKLKDFACSFEITNIERDLRGTVSQDFMLLVFSWISFPQAPDYTKRAVSNFSKICGDIRSSRFATGVNDTGGKWKKSSMRNFFMISFGHLWVVELVQRNIFFQVHFKLSAV